VSRKLRIQPVRYGVYMGKANAVCLEDSASEYDVLQQKTRTTWIRSKGLHLRPRLDVRSQMAHGLARARRPQYSWLKVIIFSLFTFQPFTVVGYLKAKTKK